MIRGQLRVLLLLLAAVVVTVIAAAALPHDSGGRAGPPEATPIGQQQALLRSQRRGAPVSRDPEVLPLGSHRDRWRVLTAARHFARAFARYEIGDLRPSVMLGLRRTAARTLVAELLDRPPRVGARQRPALARVIAVRDIRVRKGSAWAVIELRRRGRRTGLALELDRAPGRFIVTKVA